jgi:uncharacterized membrane protein YbaN (DUF454 family)
LGVCEAGWRDPGAKWEAALLNERDQSAVQHAWVEAEAASPTLKEVAVLFMMIMTKIMEGKKVPVQSSVASTG